MGVQQAYAILEAEAEDGAEALLGVVRRVGLRERNPLGCARRAARVDEVRQRRVDSEVGRWLVARLRYDCEGKRRRRFWAQWVQHDAWHRECHTEPSAACKRRTEPCEGRLGGEHASGTTVGDGEGDALRREGGVNGDVGAARLPKHGLG